MSRYEHICKERPREVIVREGWVSGGGFLSEGLTERHFHWEMNLSWRFCL